MWRFLPGIVLIQLATLAVAFALLKAPLQGMQWVAIGILGLLLSVLSAFWFSAIAQGEQQRHVDSLREQHAREREKLRVNAERQKSKVLKDSHREILKEAKRSEAKANFKVGAAFAGVAAVGGLMLFTQFLTVGMLLLGTSGGALAGYLTRLRQERRRLQKAETALLPEK
ncbi:MAG: hypothetical protein ACWA5X_05910 [bacterium]